jgi:hypothetical protein
MAVVFAVQDETGTVTQLTILPSPLPINPISPGDTGIYAGYPDDGTALFAAPAFQSLPFTVLAVASNGYQFAVGTKNANMADWPAFGLITWQTGANATATSTVTNIDGANAYIDPLFAKTYHASRGNIIPASATTPVIQAAIVQSTDYLDQKYRYSGVKLLQTYGVSMLDANSTFLEAWLTPYSLTSASYLTPTTTTQSTEWPRRGVVDFNGDSINGIPKAIKAACAELTIRVLNGLLLQPDYDTGIVGSGGVVSSVTKKVGPLETVVAYDTKLGLGFFASFPQIDRMLAKAGLLSSGGSRTVIR